MSNLEQDSLSDDESLNSEVAVLNKINATNVLTLRSVQDTNKLLMEAFLKLQEPSKTPFLIAWTLKRPKI